MSTYRCDLEKRARGKGFISSIKSNWQLRTVVITGQMLSYFAGSELKGSVSVAKCHVELLESDASTDNKPFPFELQIEKESILFSAANEHTRSVVVNILSQACRSPEWINPESVSPPAPPPAYIDVDAVFGALDTGRQELSKKGTVELFASGPANSKLKAALVTENSSDAREYAALKIQHLYRAKCCSQRKEQNKEERKRFELQIHAAREIQRCYRAYVELQRWKVAQYHQHPFLMKVKVNELRFKKSTVEVESQRFIVVISSIKIQEGDKDLSEDQRLNSGICVTCDYTSPTDGLVIDQNVYVGGLTSSSYIAVTVLREAARIEYIGQGHVRLIDHSNELFLKNSSLALSIPLGKAKVQIRKDGGNFAEIGQELHLAGSVELTLSLTRSSFNMAGHVTKLTETLVASNFKKRYAVLCDGVLSYFGSPYSLFDVKHFIRCEDVISLTEDEGRNGDWYVEIKTQEQVTEKGARVRGDVWMLKWNDQEYSKKYRKEWIRKILRNCPRLPNPDIEELKKKHNE